MLSRRKARITLVEPWFSFMNFMGRQSVNVLFDDTYLYSLQKLGLVDLEGRVSFFFTDEHRLHSGKLCLIILTCIAEVGLTSYLVLANSYKMLSFLPFFPSSWLLGSQSLGEKIFPLCIVCSSPQACNLWEQVLCFLHQCILSVWHMVEAQLVFTAWVNHALRIDNGL